MPRRLTSALRRKTPRFLLELLIVVLGVSISFLLHDWRQARADRSEERRILENFATDLRLDAADLRLRTEILTKAAAGVQQLLAPDSPAKLDAAAKDELMDSLLGYLTFSPSTATYLELRQTGSSRLIRDKTIVHSLIGLYERGYPGAREWDEINRTFVLERMFPFVDEHGPATQADVSGAYARGYHVVLDALVDDTRFRNLLRSSAMFKEGQRMVYQAVGAAVARTLEQLDAAMRLP